MKYWGFFSKQGNKLTRLYFYKESELVYKKVYAYGIRGRIFKSRFKNIEELKKYEGKECKKYTKFREVGELEVVVNGWNY